MNDQLLDTMQEKQRPFNQTEAIKKEATLTVDDAINSIMSSHNDLCQRAFVLD